MTIQNLKSPSQTDKIWWNYPIWRPPSIYSWPLTQIFWKLACKGIQIWNPHLKQWWFGWVALFGQCPSISGQLSCLGNICNRCKYSLVSSNWQSQPKKVFQDKVALFGMSPSTYGWCLAYIWNKVACLPHTDQKSPAQTCLISRISLCGSSVSIFGASLDSRNTDLACRRVEIQNPHPTKLWFA